MGEILLLFIMDWRDASQRSAVDELLFLIKPILFKRVLQRNFDLTVLYDILGFFVLSFSQTVSSSDFDRICIECS